MLERRPVPAGWLAAVSNFFAVSFKSRRMPCVERGFDSLPSSRSCCRKRSLMGQDRGLCCTAARASDGISDDAGNILAMALGMTFR